MNINDIKPDVDRLTRLGFDEAIYCEGKTIPHLEEILENAVDQNQRLLLTRLRKSQYEQLGINHKNDIDFDENSWTGFYGQLPTIREDPLVAVITAGTSDIRVGREVVRTLEYYGESCVEVNDVGVAGIWRLFKHIDRIRSKPVKVVIAGMDAALPSVIGGLVDGLVIAVPTSTGYGIMESGKTALRAALSSCSPGVVVVNIDNGYGAATAAQRMLNILRAESQD